MLYRVLMDGTDILDFTNKDLVLLSPQVTIEIDTAGSFEFTVPPNHRYYNRFFAESIMAMTIEVWEGNILHFFGRPMEFHLDFYKNKKIYCEGALSFFNDSVIRESEYEAIALSSIFSAVIGEHNSMVSSNRQFSVGNFTVADENVYRKFNYEQTTDALKSKFLDAVDGHFFVRRENGVNYIDLLKDMPYTCNQNVEFAENLLNFTYSFDGKDFATCVIPLGKNDEETGKPINISSVNGGSDILVGAAAINYGNIVKVQQYGDIDDPTKLIAEGQKYLTTLQWNAFLIECSAVDLNATDATKQQFRVGQVVHCISNPHGIEMDLPISKMILYLDSAAKQITLGRIPKKTLSRFYKEKVTGNSNGESGGEIDDVLPDGYGIIDDPTTGEPTLIKVPVTMQIITLPYRDGSQQNSTYNYGDTLMFDGLTAKLVAKGLSRDDPPDTPMTYFSDSNYPTGDIPFNELSFTPTTYNQHAGKLMCWAIWNNPRRLYNGITFRKPFYMHSLSEAALELADMPEYIRVTADGPISRKTFKLGEYIDYSTLVVRAYKSNGDLYDAPGYTNGIIPVSELEILPKYVDGEEDILNNGFVSDINTGVFSQPINAYKHLVMSTKDKNQYSQLEQTLDFNEYGYVIPFTIPTNSGTSIGYITASRDGGEIIGTLTQKSWVKGHESEASQSSSNVQVRINGYTINNKSVWVELSGTWPWFEFDQSSNNLIAYPTVSDFQAAAWTVFYGHPTIGYKTISVNWKRPDGVTLTTTFQIKVGSSTNTGR